jgi:flagellar basal-body rod protein FlgG
MFGALYTAATGMKAQQTNVDVISNNIANLSTDGYKRQRAEFQDLLYQDFLRVGTNSSDNNTIIPTGVQIGIGVSAGAVYRITTQGSLTQTGNNLDLAMSGRGYFQVDLPDGEVAYTRDGSFQLNAQGQIVNAQGYTVVPGITVPSNATSVTISQAGQVSVSIDGQIAPSVVGQLTVATFVNEAGLDAQGNNLLLQTEASGPPVVGDPQSPGFGTIQQGFVETSNVDVVTEITSLITAQRAYEENSRVISASDQMLQNLTQIS